MTTADRPGGPLSDRATPGHGYVVQAGDGAVARERAHWPERRGAAGLPLTVRFETLGGLAYVRCAGTRCGRQERRLLAWPRMVGNRPAARNDRHFLQSNGRAAWATMRAAFSTPGARRIISAFRHRTLDGYRVSGDGPAFHRFGNRVRVSQVGSGRVGGEAPGDHDGGGGQPTTSSLPSNASAKEPSASKRKLNKNF